MAEASGAAAEPAAEAPGAAAETVAPESAAEAPEATVSEAGTTHRMSAEDAAFIAAREAEAAAEFRKAVEDWRASKATGGGQAVIAEVGGCFAPESAAEAAAPEPAAEASEPAAEALAPEMRKCSHCGHELGRDKFSKGQWRKGASARCLECIKQLVHAPLVAKHQGWSTGKTKRPDQVQGPSKCPKR